MFAIIPNIGADTKTPINNSSVIIIDLPICFQFGTFLRVPPIQPAEVLSQYDAPHTTDAEPAVYFVAMMSSQAAILSIKKGSIVKFNRLDFRSPATTNGTDFMSLSDIKQARGFRAVGVAAGLTISQPFRIGIFIFFAAGFTVSQPFRTIILNLGKTNDFYRTTQ